MDTVARPLDATLVDALSKGTLTCAEIGGLTGRELNALYLSGQQALLSKQLQKAVVLFSVATELMPYHARFWRALGVSLHCQENYLQARAAYQAALYLLPDHAATQMYLAETLYLLNDGEQAQRLLDSITAPLPEELRSRRKQVDALFRAQDFEKSVILDDVPSIGPALEALSTAQELTLTDGRVLPLDRFDRDAVLSAPNDSEDVDIAVTPKERTELTAIALGQVGSLWFTEEVSLGNSGEADACEEEMSVATTLRRDKNNDPPGERTLAFRLRLSAASSLNDEVTQAGSEPERTLTQTRARQ